MLRELRKEKILEILERKKKFSIEDLSNYLDISVSTIYRDLNELAIDNKVIKSHGLVLLKNDSLFDNRLRTNLEKKVKIARKSLELIKDDDSLFIDNSSTCYYFAEEILKSDYKNLTIITFSSLIPGLFVSRKNMKIVSTGGIYNSEHQCFTGSSALDIIRQYNVNKFFFSMSAISIDIGLSDIPLDVRIEDYKNEMKDRSRESICLVDSTKFKKSTTKIFYSIDSIDKVVTDSGVEEEIIKKFKEFYTELIIAD